MKIRHFYKIILFLILLQIPFLSLFSRNTAFYFKQLTTKDGLRDNTILSVLQDEMGFMWFGGFYGLYKYDGKKIYAINNNLFSESEFQNQVWLITEDKKNHQLWTLVGNSIFTLDLRTENVEKFNTGIKGNIYTLFIDQDNTLWVSIDKKLYTLSQSNNRLLEWNVIPELQDKTVITIKQTPQGLYCFLTKNDGAYIYDKKKGRVTCFKGNVRNAMSFLYDSEKRLWIGAWNGLYQWKPDSQIFQYVKLDKQLNENNIHGITQILEKEPGTIYISSDRGLYCYTPGKSEIVHIKSEYQREGALNCSHINDLYFDNEKNLWVPTYLGGVNYSSYNSQNFLRHDFVNRKMSGHTVSAFAEDKNGNLWIGTEDGGISFFNRHTEEVMNYNPKVAQNDLIDFYNVHALFIDDDHLYIGKVNTGCTIYNLKDKSVKNLKAYGPAGYRLTNQTIYSFAKIDKENIAIGTYQGLDIYNTQTGRIENVNEVPKQTIHKILKGDHHDLWVCGKEIGVYNKTPQKGWHKLQGILPTDAVFTMTLDDGILYLGTQAHGVICYDLRTQKVHSLLAKELAQGVVYTLLAEKDDLWICTSQGLYQYNKKNKICYLYTEEDHLKSRQMNVNAGIITHDGTIFVGSYYGLNSFRPNELKFDAPSSPMFFTEMSVNGKPLAIGEKEGDLKYILPYTQHITLQHNQSNLSIQYASLSYAGKGIVTYRYKLLPSEKNWTQTNSNQLSFSQLKAGDYTLVVQSRNGDGEWSDKECRLKLTILPPWWLSPYMYVCYALLSLAFIYWCYRHFKSKQEQRIEEIKMEQQKEIYDSKLEFFTNVIHDIRTPLTLIISPLLALRKKKETAPFNYELDLIQRNSERLINNINQLMDFQKLENGSFISHNDEPIEVVAQLNEIAKDFHYSFENKNIEFAIETEVKDKKYWISCDKTIFDKIFTNLLSNALKYTQTTVRIVISEEEEECLIAVIDDGTGISEEDKKYIFEPFYQVKGQKTSQYKGTGIGLFIVKRMVEEIKGKLFVESVYGQGTNFKIRIPFCKELPLPKEAIHDIKTVTAAVPVPSEVDMETDSTDTEQWTIGVVEDNEDLCGFICSILAPHYKAYPYHEANALLQDIEKIPFDLIISDVMMPGMDGFELCKTIKSNPQTDHIPVILLTAKILEQDEIAGLKCGADDYIRKPFSVDILLTRLNNLIKNRKLLLDKFKNEPAIQLPEVLKNNTDKDFIRKLNEVIIKNMDNPQLTAKDVASELCICRTLFFSKIKAISGMGFVDYLRITRLKQAVNLMATKDLTLTEISEKTGFSSLTYFSRSFKQQFGKTPSEYLRGNHAANDKATEMEDSATKNIGSY